MSGKINDSKKIFISKAKTFSLAALLLPQKKYNDIIKLYAFCRLTDDLADSEPFGSNHNKLLEIKNDCLLGVSDQKIISDFLILKEEYKIPNLIIVDFLDALIVDQYPRKLKTLNELVNFSYGVASTVGLMICYIFEVKNKDAVPYAIDLGIAMQLTNICRDVLEDANKKRIYLPSDLSKKELNLEKLIMQNSNQKKIAMDIILILLNIADEYYDNAKKGYVFLPIKIRYSIMIASKLYREIGNKIRSEKKHYWGKRISVSLVRKIFLIICEVLNVILNISKENRKNFINHQSSLYKKFYDLDF